MKAFNESQKSQNKIDGEMVAKVMPPSPLLVCATINLEDVATFLQTTVNFLEKKRSELSQYHWN